MTQYVEMPQSFAATTSYVVQGASPGIYNLRDLHYRVAQKSMPGKGTTRFGTLQIASSIATAAVSAGGTGYAVNDTVTLAGGTFTTAAIVTVTSVSAGVVTGLSLTNPGFYTVKPGSPASQGSTSGAGTGLTVTITFNERRFIMLPDDVYASMVSAGVDFSDAIYNSSTAPGTTSNTTEVLPLFNPGTHRQVILCVGDSITNLAIGATAYKRLAIPANRTWARGMGSAPGGITYAAPAALPSTATQPPDHCYHNRSAHEKSRLKFNLGADSWRLQNQTGFSYNSPTPLTGAPHMDNVPRFAKFVAQSGQQIVTQIFAGTNDFAYADQNSNPGLSAVPTGTPGYTYTGSPNYITDCLIPFIALAKAANPGTKILFVVPLARGVGASLNAKFAEVASYVIANKATLGVDVVLDSRQITQFSCLTPSVTSSTVYYQDGTHPTPAGADILDPYFEAAYDKLLGFTPNPTYAGAIA